MTIAALIELLPLIVQGGIAIEQGFTEIGALIAKLRADAREQTDAEEQSDLKDTLAALGITHAAFEAEFSKY